MRAVADSGIAFQRHVIPIESCLVESLSSDTVVSGCWYLISHTVAGLGGSPAWCVTLCKFHNFSSLGPLYNVKQFRQEAPRS